MTRLSVNINKVATLRNTRTIGIPGVVHVAKLALDAGAHGITVHPRPDRRHIIPEDVYELAELLKEYPEAEFNIEGNPFHEFMHFARDVRPTQCTLVPDSPEVFTSDQGWNVATDGERLMPIIEQLHEYGCRVSLFMDPVVEQINLVPATGADRIELYTEPYAAAYAAGDYAQVLDLYVRGAQHALDLGLGINAGHDLNLQNLHTFLSSVPDVAEVSIGHALIAEALEFGMAETVRRYLAIVNWTDNS
jgi:pyridoxine 5-phosphate synthase